jgi:hypothetical protein
MESGKSVTNDIIRIGFLLERKDKKRQEKRDKKKGKRDKEKIEWEKV